MLEVLYKQICDLVKLNWCNVCVCWKCCTSNVCVRLSDIEKIGVCVCVFYMYVHTCKIYVQVCSYFVLMYNHVLCTCSLCVILCLFCATCVYWNASEVQMCVYVICVCKYV